MKKIATLLFIGAGFLITAQKVKDEVLKVEREIPHLLVKEDTPVKIAIFPKMVNSVDIANNEIQVGNTRSINMVYKNHQYIAVVEYSDEPISVSIEKLANYNYDVSAINTATLYLIHPEKGLMFSTKLMLKKAENSITVVGNGFENINFLNANAAFGNSGIDETRFSQMFDIETRQLLPHVQKQLFENQKYRLMILAHSTLASLLTDRKSYEKMEYNYIKKSDDFNSTEFDKAYLLVKNNLEPLKPEPLREAIKIWDIEQQKYTDTGNKDIKKYKEAILQNILYTQYLISDFTDSQRFTDELNKINPKNRTVSWYLSKKKEAEDDQSFREKNKEIMYSPVSDQILTQPMKNILQ